jgi:hypothetical protein
MTPPLLSGAAHVQALLDALPTWTPTGWTPGDGSWPPSWSAADGCSAPATAAAPPRPST